MKIRLLPLSAALAAALTSAGAQAANDGLLELLRVLKEQGTITAEAYEQLVSAAKADDEATTTDTVQVEQEAAQTLPKVETKDKLEISSPDGDYTWKLRGRVQTDAAFYDNDGGTTLSSGADIRRARLGIEATLYRHWQFKFEYDFAGAGAVDEGVADAYLRYLYEGPQPFAFTVGHFKEYLGLESLASTNDVSFIERALPSRTFHNFAGGNGRRIGVGASTYGHDLWTASVGVYGRSIEGETGDDDESDPIAFVGRLTLSPIHTDTRVAHLGFAGSWLTPDDNDTVRFRERPEARIGADRLVDTGDLDAKDVVRYGVEAAGVYGPYSLQGEYLRAEVNRELAANPDVAFDGWYVQGSWILTGESRRYEFEDGFFKNPKPHGIVGKGGIGAWELVARYSTLDLSDGVVDGGEEDNVTAGLNWYPTPAFRFMANYVKVLDIDGGDFDGANPDIFEVRAQAYW